MSITEFTEHEKHAWCEPCREGKPEECVHGTMSCPEWATEQREKKAKKPTGGMDSAPTAKMGEGGGYGYTGYGSGIGSGSGYSGGSGFSNKGFPFSLHFRCMSCGHWFKSDTTLADHVKWSCPADKDNMGETLSWAVACACCASLDNTVIVKDGFPLASSEQEEAAEEEVQDPGEEEGEEHVSSDEADPATA